MKYLLRRFSRSSLRLQDQTFQIPTENEVSELSSSERRSHELFSEIFDSVFEKKAAQNTATENQKRSASAAISQIFKPAPVFSHISASTAPISLIDEKSVLAKRPQRIEYMQPVFDHIASLKTNVEISNYFFTTVVDKFDANCKVWTSPTAEGPFAPQTIGYVLNECLMELIALKDPMGALSMFANAKNLEPQVAEAACSASVYNTIILLQWEFYRDFKQCVDLTSEMSLHAVAGNADTARLLSQIMNEALEAKRNVNAKESAVLWDRRDDKRVDLMLSHRRCIIDALAAREGMPRANIYS